MHTNWVQWIGTQSAGGQTIGRGPLASCSADQTAATRDNLRTAYGDTGNGSGIIAIVDALRRPERLSDFNTVIRRQTFDRTRPSGN